MIYHGDDDLSDWPQNVTQTVAKLAPYGKRRFDSIVIQGMSGVLVGAPAALELAVPLIVVRKESEFNDCHSGRRVINLFRVGKRFLFLDDFIAWGDTFGRVLKEIAEQCKRDDIPAARCTAIYQYRYNSLSLKPGGYKRDDTWQVMP